MLAVLSHLFEMVEEHYYWVTYVWAKNATFGISQQQTPQPLVRPERQVRSPDVLTYSEGHVRAQQRAKRVRRPRGG